MSCSASWAGCAPLTSSWTGTAASSFDGYYEQFNTSWSQCEQALNGIADLLNASAGSYDDTEAGVAGAVEQFVERWGYGRGRLRRGRGRHRRRHAMTTALAGVSSPRR